MASSIIISLIMILSFGTNDRTVVEKAGNDIEISFSTSRRVENNQRMKQPQITSSAFLKYKHIVANSNCPQIASTTYIPSLQKYILLRILLL